MYVHFEIKLSKLGRITPLLNLIISWSYTLKPCNVNKLIVLCYYNIIIALIDLMS
jgi:hypothetical protein